MSYGFAPRLYESRRAMAQEHSGFSFELVRHGPRPLGVWNGSVQPIKTIDGLFELLDDLHHDREVKVVGDDVRHLPSCQSDHCRHDWMKKIKDLKIRFTIRIAYSGGKADPRCWVMDPPIPFSKREHMWSDDAICPFLSSEKVWLWHSHTVADFVPHVLIWLVKWMVYDQTEEWIGSQHKGTPVYHLEHIHPKDPCWCGGGDEYRKCHRKEDMQKTQFI